MHISVRKEVTGSPAGKTGLIILSVIVLLAVFAPFLAFHDPYAQTATSLQPPSPGHWLGTDHVGQDIGARLLYGARTSLAVGFGVGALGLLLSVFFGVSAALIGGWYDRIIMRIVDAFIIIPMLVLVILIAAYMRPGLPALIIILALLSWQPGARVVRAQALSLKERGHIAASRSFGAGSIYIASRHIIPDLGPILLVEFIHGVRRAVFMEAGLAFIGIGDASLVSWGTMMRDAMRFTYLDVWIWWLLPPGVMLSLTIIALTYIGHAAETVLDPGLRGEAVA